MYNLKLIGGIIMTKINEEYSKTFNDKSNRYEYRIGCILVVEDSYKTF